jgi:hypothetical protein
MMRQLEFGAHFKVTLKTGLRRFARIDDQFSRATTLHVKTARPVARFATHVLGIVTMRLQARVRRSLEILGDRLVTGGALFRTNKLGAGNTRRGEEGSGGAAGKQNERQRDGSTGTPKKLFVSTAKPSS